MTFPICAYLIPLSESHVLSKYTSAEPVSKTSRAGFPFTFVFLSVEESTQKQNKES